MIRVLYCFLLMVEYYSIFWHPEFLIVSIHNEWFYKKDTNKFLVVIEFAISIYLDLVLWLLHIDDNVNQEWKLVGFVLLRHLNINFDTFTLSWILMIHKLTNKGSDEGKE